MRQIGKAALHFHFHSDPDPGPSSISNPDLGCQYQAELSGWASSIRSGHVSEPLDPLESLAVVINSFAIVNASLQHF